jgi:hypothetical protein
MKEYQPKYIQIDDETKECRKNTGAKKCGSEDEAAIK